MSQRSPEKSYEFLKQALEKLSDEVRGAYLDFHEEHVDKFLLYPAAISHHHNYPGGYAVHVAEVMDNLGRICKGLLLPDLKCTKDDLIISAYIHDLDKLLYRYEIEEAVAPSDKQRDYAARLGIVNPEQFTAKTISLAIDAAIAKQPIPYDKANVPTFKHAEGLEFEDGAIVMYLCSEYKLPVSLAALHAVCVHHGGWSELVKGRPKTKMSELGVLLHTADLISAKVQHPCLICWVFSV